MKNVQIRAYHCQDVDTEYFLSVMKVNTRTGDTCETRQKFPDRATLAGAVKALRMVGDVLGIVVIVTDSDNGHKVSELGFGL